MLIKESLIKLQHLSGIESDLASYFLNKGNNIKLLSSRAIASELFIAPSTVSRFCQSLGFSGYTDFKENFLEEVYYLERNFQDIDPNYPFSERDLNIRLASKIANLYIETVEDSLTLLSHDSFQAATKIISSASTIYFGMVGDTYEMAETFKNRMIKIGKSVVIERRSDNLFYSASQVDTNSCFILISYSGETESLIKVASQLKRRKIPTIVLTSFGDNTLSKMFEVVIRLSTREKLVENLGNFSSLISVSFVLDSLYASVFQKNYSENYETKVRLSHEFEYKRKSENPLLDDSQ